MKVNMCMYHQKHITFTEAVRSERVWMIHEWILRRNQHFFVKSSFFISLKWTKCNVAVLLCVCVMGGIIPNTTTAVTTRISASTMSVHLFVLQTRSEALAGTELQGGWGVSDLTCCQHTQGHLRRECACMYVCEWVCAWVHVSLWD